MSKISTTYRLSCDKISIIYRFSHDRIDNEIYYSDLLHKLIIKRRKIMIIQYIISCYSLSVSSILLLLFSISHLIISYIIIINYLLIHTLSVSASVFFILDELEFFLNFHNSSFS